MKPFTFCDRGRPIKKSFENAFCDRGRPTKKASENAFCGRGEPTKKTFENAFRGRPARKAFEIAFCGAGPAKKALKKGGKPPYQKILVCEGQKPSKFLKNDRISEIPLKEVTMISHSSNEKFFGLERAKLGTGQ